MRLPKYSCSAAGLLILILVLFLGGSLPGLFSQESILASYERNFARASLANKAGILSDAAVDDSSPEFIGPLYEFALHFVLENGELLRDDPDMIVLAGIAARGAGEAAYKPSAETLWNIFVLYRDSHSRVEILQALAVLGKGNAQMVENLNQFLIDQNTYFRSGMAPDYPTVQACAAALAAIGDASSFSALFSAMTLSYPEALSAEIDRAMNSIEGDYFQFLIGVIRRNPSAEKLAAFRAGFRNEKFSAVEKGELAEAALDVALNLFPADAEAPGRTPPAGWNEITSLRYESIVALTALKWIRASPLAIRNFYQVQLDWTNYAAPKGRFMEAINCLGAMGNSESAQVLALQMGFINSQVEGGAEFDEDLIVALVQALGEIGDKIAFDHLLYIGYLDYPERIHAAAKDSLNRLKW